MIQLGTKIKTLRIKNNLTQAQLGELLNVTSAMISAYETDKRMPSYHTLIKLTKIFHVTSDYLLGIEKEASLEELQTVLTKDVASNLYNYLKELD